MKALILHQELFITKNLSDFVAKLSKNILDSLKPYGRKAIETFWNCVHSLQSGISFSPSGDVSFNVQLGDIHYGQNTLDYILATSEYSFKETIFRLPEKQKNVLVALAKAGPVKQITSGAFIRQHHLPSASSVQAAVKGLLEKDFITCELGEYKVYDLFLAEWIIRQ